MPAGSWISDPSLSQRYVYLYKRHPCTLLILIPCSLNFEACTNGMFVLQISAGIVTFITFVIDRAESFKKDQISR